MKNFLGSKKSCSAVIKVIYTKTFANPEFVKREFSIQKNFQSAGAPFGSFRMTQASSTYICLLHTTHNQSVLFVNSRHPLHTRNLQARQGAPRLIILPKYVRQRAQDRLLSTITGLSSEFPALSTLRFFKFWSSARKSLPGSDNEIGSRGVV